MNTEFAKIETLISQLDSVDRAAPVLSSLSWSFAMSIGQSIARLERVWDEEDPTYGNMDTERRVEAQTRLERRIEDMSLLLSWAWRGAIPDYAPSGADVADRIIVNDMPTKDYAEETIEALAEEMDATIAEVKQALAANDQRMARDAECQAIAARNAREAIVTAVDQCLGDQRQVDDYIDINAAIRIVDRVADKAAQYAEQALANALRQRRARRRTQANAERRLLLDIERQADDLLDRLETERNAASSEQELEPQRQTA